MGLSEVMRTALNDIIELPPQPGETLGFQVGGEWHCPADGKRMVERDGRVQCPGCQRALPRTVIYNLVEFHRHS